MPGPPPVVPIPPPLPPQGRGIPVINTRARPRTGNTVDPRIWIAIAVLTPVLLVPCCCGGLLVISGLGESGGIEGDGGEFASSNGSVSANESQSDSGSPQASAPTGSGSDESEAKDWGREIDKRQKQFGEPTVWTVPNRDNMKVLIWNKTPGLGKDNGTYDTILVVSDGSGNQTCSGSFNLDYEGLQKLLSKLEKIAGGR